MVDGTARDPDDRLSQVEQLLAVEFDAIVGRATVTAFVQQSAARFADAKIADFVPIFAERETRRRLRAEAARKRENS